jgi:hypothetical protein
MDSAIRCRALQTVSSGSGGPIWDLATCEFHLPRPQNLRDSLSHYSRGFLAHFCCAVATSLLDST